MTKQLVWHFGGASGEDVGPKDSLEYHFKGNKYYSIAREAIQNSLDAILDANQPVRVEFKLSTIQRDSIPELFGIQETLNHCLSRWKNDKNGQIAFSSAVDILNRDEMRCLRVSDFNTKGMKYEVDEGSFYAFMKAVGVNQKDTRGSGGSFGFGKGAYYAASMIKSILVSSQYYTGEVVFQGKSRLATHYDSNQNKKDSIGYFGLRGEPVLDLEEIPPGFSRKEPGTDIIILGFNDEGDWKESLIKSVLNNFWLAIWDEKLIVEIEDTVIDKTNLEKIISQFYTEASADGRVSEPENWNPYPYFKAVKYSADKALVKVFEKKLPTLGVAKLFVFSKDDLPNRTIFMRAPRMTVYKRTDNKSFNYAAVFICEDIVGNEILRLMENPQHNEWKKYNYLDKDKPHANAVKAEREIRDFLKESLDSLSTVQAGKNQKILGLEKYLYIPEDLLPEDEVQGTSVGSAAVSHDFSLEETGAETNTKEGESSYLKLRSQASALSSVNAMRDENGHLLILEGGGLDDDNPRGTPGPPTIPGDNPEIGSPAEEGAAKTPLNIRFRSMAQRTSSLEIEHFIKIFASRDAIIDLNVCVGADNEGESEDNSLPIISASIQNQILNISGNIIRRIPIRSGENMVKVLFDSNQKHSLKLKSHEV